MIGHKPGLYWKLCWGFITPTFMIVILIYFLITYRPLEYNGVAYPTTAYGMNEKCFLRYRNRIHK